MANDGDNVRVYADPLATWFVTEAYRIADTAELIRAAGEQLVAAGIPLYRLAYFQLTLHAELAGKAYSWRRGQGVHTATAPHGLFNRPEYRDSPLTAVFEQRKTIRVRLEQRDDVQQVLREFKQEGATDYVALPLIFTTGHVDGLSVVSDKPGGFSRQDLDRMFLLQFAFTRIVEVHSLRDTAINLLDAYVGHVAGERILAGEIIRGEGQTIEAVIWCCDLRGFTRASDHLPRPVLIALLNDYFTAMGDAVTTAGGEILKFMGDGMLAMFPAAAADAKREAAARALGAARAAAKAIAGLNEARGKDGRPLIRFGLALHIGEVMFGNIGASKRLDFTVIGPAVNHVARLEKLSGELRQPILVSAALAVLLPADELVPLGAHEVKDIDLKQEVYALKL